MSRFTEQQIMNHNKKLWKIMMEQTKLRFDLSDITYKTWLAPLKLYRVECDTLVVIAPLAASIDYLTKKFGAVIADTIEKYTGEKYSIRFISE